MEYKNCPSCTKKLDGFMTSRSITKQSTTDFINLFHEPKAEAYCSDCAPNLITQYKDSTAIRIEELNKAITKDLNIIPIITIQSPLNWQYEILEMITSQSISGTGFLTELSSSWSDLTGGQSSSMASKVSSGEDICKAKLRYQCALLGGNAIIGTDIDYSEVGGGKGMLMVCMAGTAIKINDDKLPLNKLNRFKSLAEQANELSKLKALKYPDLVYAI